MTQYEALVDHAESRGIQVIEFDFTSELKGLCIGNYIGIKKDLPDDEKLVTLYEELAHAQTSFGNILDQRNPNNRKQEQIARRRAHDEFMPVDKFARIIVAHRPENKWQMLYALMGQELCVADLAELIGAPQAYIDQLLAHYQQKYGLYTEFDGGSIWFDPLEVALYGE